MAGSPDQTTDILEAVALLVVDMQAAVTTVIPDAETVCTRTGFAIAAAQACGLKVVFTEQVPEKLGGTDPRLRALAPQARVFAKQSFSALQAEGLQAYLKQHGIYHLLVAGIETPVCVYQTALHAVDFDFDVTILTDCVGGRRSDDCRAVLESLARSNCHLLPAETVFYSMLATSAHPKFRPFTELVKRFGGPDPFTGPPLENSWNGDRGPDESPASAPPPGSATRQRRGGRRRKSSSGIGEAAASSTAAAPKQIRESTPGSDSAPTTSTAKPRPRRRRGGAGRRRTQRTTSSGEASPASAES